MTDANNLTGCLSKLGRSLIVPIALALLAAQLNGSAAAEGAKNLFYRQIDQPSAPLNTGLQYWIELKRAGKVQSVSNKFAFKSGDKIRIHVKSNIEGFAYVMLVEGSRGEQSVLFPDPQFNDNNKVRPNQDIPIPQEGYLAFDQNPGTEKVVLLLSRTQMDAGKYIADKAKAKARVQIAAVPDGAKDLIPGSVVLAYAEQDNQKPSAADGAEQVPVSPGSTAAANSKVNDNRIVGSANSSNVSLSEPVSATDSAVTTLVQKNPEEVLAVDVSLTHQP